MTSARSVCPVALAAGGYGLQLAIVVHREEQHKSQTKKVMFLLPIRE